MLAFVILVCGVAGGFLWGNWYGGRERRRPRQSTPVIRHRMQDVDTTQIISAALLDEQRRAGVPSTIEPTPTTGVSNPRRKVP